VQIESQIAFKNAKDIISTAGIDAFFFGPDDMAMADGLPMDQARSIGTYRDMLKALADLGKQYDVVAGGAFATPEAVANAVELGYRLIGAGGDAMFLANGSQEQREKIRKVCNI
jgi:2-keto-3-deoxy-L-rhamnonate aldolase RhmA